MMDATANGQLSPLCFSPFFCSIDAIIDLHIFGDIRKLLDGKFRPNYFHPRLFAITDSRSSFTKPLPESYSDMAYSAAIKTSLLMAHLFSSVPASTV